MNTFKESFNLEELNKTIRKLGSREESEVVKTHNLIVFPLARKTTFLKGPSI